MKDGEMVNFSTMGNSALAPIPILSTSVPYANSAPSLVSDWALAVKEKVRHKNAVTNKRLIQCQLLFLG